MTQVTAYAFSQISTTFIAGILLFLLYRLLKQSTASKRYKYPPGPRGWPIFGNILSLIFTKLQQHELLTKWSEQYGRIYSFKLFSSRIVILSDVDLVREAFQNPDVSDRMPFTPTDILFGRKNNGVIFSNGQTWTEQRRFFNTVFRKVDIGVHKFEDIIGSQAQYFLTEVEKLNGDRFDPSNMISISIANIITRIITGITYDYNDSEFQHVMECSNRLFDKMGPAGLYGNIPFLASLPLPTNWEINRVVREIIEFISKAIDDRRKTFNPDEPVTDFISCYLKEMADRSEENKGSFDDINLRQSCADTLVGGWETVATTLRWALFILATHPESQERAREEIHEVVGQNKFPAFSSRHKLPLTEATIAECMRFIPSVPLHLAHIVNKDCKIGGYDVPEGSAVVANLWFLATSPTLWDKPEEFRPERFLDASGDFDRRLEPIPFGFGRRICPGEPLARMELFLFMTYILQRFTLKLPDGAPKTLDGITSITYRPCPYEIHAVKLE